MSYNEKLKEIMDGMPDEPDKPDEPEKPNLWELVNPNLSDIPHYRLNINIKTTELCDACRYSWDNWCNHYDCTGCERDEGMGKPCQCTTIDHGSPCPWYEKA